MRAFGHPPAIIAQIVDLVSRRAMLALTTGVNVRLHGDNAIYESLISNDCGRCASFSGSLRAGTMPASEAPSRSRLSSNVDRVL